MPQAVLQRFDREPELEELLAGPARARVEAALAGLLGGDYRVVDAGGKTVLGAGATGAAPAAQRAPLRLQLETLGYLEAPCAPPHRLAAAAALIEVLLLATARYRMASDLHLEAVHADFEALRQQHAALRESERRYRELAEELESRVQEQVKTIESAQRQLYQAEKMASVGQLAAGVAHEINNPIGFLRSNLNTASGYVRRLGVLAPLIESRDMERLAAQWQRDDFTFVVEDFAALLEESISGADRVARIVADLKTFSSIDKAEQEVTDLNESLRTVCRVAAAEIGARAQVSLELQPLPPLRCNAGRLNQVFLNLLLNAAQAVAGEGMIRIQTAAGGNELRIAVSDNGRGIAEQDLARIFDPFYTTRPVGSGTGLGLPVARDIVRAHGGRIEVRSKPGAGTTVTVFLPVSSCAGQ